jgi:mRNA-degrading endonuclease RelE of RelBE toxin-antitoxin system
VYRVGIVPEALEELENVPVYYRRAIEDAIERRLSREPCRLSKNCKKLEAVVAKFAYEPPLWQLRIGDWRVFYDVDEENKEVVIRAVRKKPKGKRTEEIV